MTTARLPELVVGDGYAPGTDMGPLITAEHRDKVASYVGAGAESGATVVVDGREADVPQSGSSWAPRSSTNVTPDMTATCTARTG